MQQTGNQNTQTLQAKVVILIYPQILITNLLQGNLQLVKRRVNSHILGLCGLSVSIEEWRHVSLVNLFCSSLIFRRFHLPPLLPHPSPQLSS